jgi:predicted GNAT family acetyltransferase
MIPESANDSPTDSSVGNGDPASEAVGRSTPAPDGEAGAAGAGPRPDPDAPIDVRHEPALARYTIWRGGEPVGLTDYAISGHEVRFTHTEVNPIYRHEGLASILVEFALDDVRERTTLRVVAQCPYVHRWIDEHAEYQDLLTRGP